MGNFGKQAEPAGEADPGEESQNGGRALFRETHRRKLTSAGQHLIQKDETLSENALRTRPRVQGAHGWGREKKHPGEVIGLSNDLGMKLWLSEDMEATDKVKPGPAFRGLWVQRSR